MLEKKITLVIPTFNKCERLRFLLESLCLQKSDIKFEVIIVDDGSDDHTPELIHSYQERISILYVRIQNSGRSHARNYGLNMVDTRYVIFCDDDLILPANYIQSHYYNNLKYPGSLIHGQIWNMPYLRFFSNPEKGIVYKELENEINSNSIFYKYLINLDCIKDISCLRKQMKLNKFERYLPYLNESSEFDYLLCTGGNISCETEIIRSVNGFDENLDERWGVEDLELGYRLKKMKNMKFVYCEDAYNIHISHYRKSFENDLDYSITCFYNKYKDNQILEIKNILLGRNDKSKN